MVSRLVLGCGTTGHAVIESLRDRAGELFVLDPDESRVESLRNEKVAAEIADITDREAIAAADRDPDIILVASEDADLARGAAEAADEIYGDALLVAYTGRGATREHRRALDAVCDDVLAPGEAVVEHVETTIATGESDRLRGLRETVESVEGTLGIFMHDNPDPDAIAAAIALTRVASWLGVESEACYYGEISHQENRAFVNLLELEVRNLERDDEIGYDAIALVDHSGPGVNDQLPPDTEIDVVIDHHPPKEEVEAGFVDIREEMGATSTMMVDYLHGYGITVETSVATALLYGIRIDTKDFSREITIEDFEAAAFLLPYADTDVLERVETPSISADTMDTIARAIRNRELDGSVLASCVGAITDRDALAQAADRLLTMQGVTVTFVYGFMEGTIYISARARGSEIDLGEALRAAFDDIGSAGGHADMAGAQITLGLFDEIEEAEEETLTAIVEDVVTRRFFETIRERPEAAPTEG